MISAKVLAPYINAVIKTTQKKKKSKTRQKNPQEANYICDRESLDTCQGSAFCSAILEYHPTLEVRQVTLINAWYNIAFIFLKSNQYSTI